MTRQKIVLLILILAFSAIILRLFYWQIVKAPILAQAATDQYYFKLTLNPVRGEIRSSDGQPLVTNQTAYLVYAEPQKIKDKLKAAKEIAPFLNFDQNEIAQKIDTDDKVWVPLARKVEATSAAKLKELNIDGLGFEKEGKRFYTESSMAAQMLGFVGSDENGQDTGYFGLEGFYNQALKGKSGFLLSEKDARGLPIVLGSSKRIAAQDGQHLKLYVDRTVQLIAEENLKNGLLKYGAKEGIVVIMNPKTGGIVASASYPNYDPSYYHLFRVEYYTNPLVSLTYEPGSTFKSLVMAAGLNEKVVDPSTRFDENGPVKIGEYAIKTWNEKYNGEMSMTQVLEKSSNPGMVFVGKKLGKDKLYSYIEKFGFGKKTEIDIQGEESAQLRPPDQWKEIDLATGSFGQGIAVTPIQMLRAVGALANNGVLMQPRIVEEIIDPNGKTINLEPKKLQQVISPATAKQITEMLISAVDKGEAKWAKPVGYRIAGKTGTAQIAIAGHYDKEKTIASFVGFAPADDPKFVMLVILAEPSTSPWGSETAAPLFFSIARELFTYYGISPKD